MLMMKSHPTVDLLALAISSAGIGDTGVSDTRVEDRGVYSSQSPVDTLRVQGISTPKQSTSSEEDLLENFVSVFSCLKDLLASSFQFVVCMSTNRLAGRHQYIYKLMLIIQYVYTSYYSHISMVVTR